MLIFIIVRQTTFSLIHTKKLQKHFISITYFTARLNHEFPLFTMICNKPRTQIV